MCPTEPRLALALVHYPVVNRKDEVIGSAVTNLDLHDIARACRTYGVVRYFVVTPYQEQRQMVDKITDHWLTGYGSQVNPDRNEAISLIRVCQTVDDAISEVARMWDEKPLVVATGTKKSPNVLSYEALRETLFTGRPVLVLLGTAWGLARKELDGVNATLAPIVGRGSYNHLSVRSAASIILDRLLAMER